MPGTPALGFGWVPKGTAWLNRARELGSPRASPVPLSDLPRTSSRFTNKTSASVPSDHPLLLQVQVRTREFFFKRRKKAWKKLRIAPSSALQVSRAARPCAPSRAPPAGERRCSPAPRASLQPRRRRAVRVCVPGRNEHRGGSGGGERRPPPRPHPESRGQTGQTASLAAGAGWGLPGSGEGPARSATPTLHLGDPGRDSNSCLLCSPRGSAFLGFLRQTPSDPECPSTAWEGEERKRGYCGCKTPGVWWGFLIIWFPTQLLPRTSSLFPGLPEQPLANSSVSFITEVIRGCCMRCKARGIIFTK